MTDEMVGQWAAIAKQVSESMQDLATINSTVIKELMEQQLNVLNTCLEASQKELELAEDLPDPKSAFSEQTKLGEEYSAKLMEIFNTTSQIISECQTNLTDWSNNISNPNKKT